MSFRTTSARPTLVRLALALASGAIPFAVMAADTRGRWGALAAAVGLALALAALVSALPLGARPATHATTLRALARPLAATATSLALLLVVLTLAAGGALPIPLAAVVVPAAFLALVASVFAFGVALGPWSVDETGAPRPLARRHGFWVVALSTALSLPMLGSFSLLDPWETHYGEVAREMIARGDWISTWWAQEGWFMSKPVLDFWMQGLAMALLDVRAAPGEMLIGLGGHVARPEWAVRMPVFLLSIVGIYLLYKGVARVFGRRAGFLGAWVLSTMPQWFLIGHQSITDMPLVACLSGAMGLLLLGIHADGAAESGVYEVAAFGRTLRVHAIHLFLGVLFAVVLPQILYLVTRNVELQWAVSPHGFRPHLDAFFSGSPGNCTLPGQPACLPQAVAHRALQPALQALLWSLLLALIVVACRDERRVQRLCFLFAWLFAGVATMGKGPAGFVLPIAAALAYIVATGRYRTLLALEIPTGLLVVAVMVAPWYVAMYARHGRLFFDELVLKHMLGRTLDHLHDTNEGDDTSFRFYIWQMGYALFPWTGLVPAAVVAWARRREGGHARGDASIFLVMWMLLAYALFASMGTKFHHYIFPAIPPAAMLTGVHLDRLARPLPRAERLAAAGAALAGAVLVALVGKDLVVTGAPGGGDVVGQARLLHLFTYQYHRAWPETLDFRVTLGVFAALAAALTLAISAPRVRRHAPALFGALSLAFALWGLDVYLVQAAPHWGQREVIAAYYAARSSRDEPLVAYQMNWKGESFYAGGRVAIFVQSGAAFTAYARSRTGDFYVVTEHDRVATLRGELGAGAEVRVMTDRALNNKFCLVRARANAH